MSMPSIRAKDLISKDRIKVIEELEADGYQITKTRTRRAAISILPELAKPGQTVKIGVVSDTHANSEEQQLTYLRDFYRYADSKGVSAFLHAGDLDDGHPRMHKDAVYHHFNTGFQRRVKYVADTYPVSQNGKTFFIEGNHDYSWWIDSGLSFGTELALRRPDMEYLGYQSATVDVGAARFSLVHGTIGGLSYAYSYKLQKYIEGLDAEERNHIDVVLMGHFHVAMGPLFEQGLAAYLLPCFQSQTNYIKRLNKQPRIGGLVLEVEFGQKGVWNIRPDWRIYKEPLLNDYPGGK
jgi:predicted phosphodiesterase